MKIAQREKPLCQWSLELDVLYLSASVIPLTWYGDQDIKALQNIHLLEASAIDEVVHLALATAVQQHQAILCAHQQVHPW